jgi:D-arabinose 1-dehydrogenase-like Zn-dependent alcohol dehydrogenase
MAAVVGTGPGAATEVMWVETVRDPTPGPREACGVGFDDVVTRNGTRKAGVGLPMFPGHGIAGTVVGGEFVPFHPAQLLLKGIWLLSATSTTREELRRALDLMARGRVHAMLSGAVPLEAAAEAHEKVESGRALSRLVVEPTA